MVRHPGLLKRFFEGWRSLFRSSSRRLTRAQANRRAVGGKLRDSHSPANGMESTAVSDANAPTYKTNSRTKASASASAKSGGFWGNLLWVHPWLLVGGLWLTFIVMIAIALTGLSNPGRELVLDPIGTAGPPLSAPDAAAVSRLSPGNDIADLNRRDPAAINPTDTDVKDMPAWPLLLMVLACAGGCMLMSNNGLLANEQSRRSQRRGMPSSAASVRPAKATIGASGRQRRKQRRLAANRPASQVMAFRTGQKIRHTSPLPKSVSAKPVSFSVNHEPTRSVTVVPKEESSPLDWKEGSLAHRLDVRKKRSINSFL